MSNGKPVWWRAFDRIERAVGEPLEAAAASPTYVDALILGMRVQRAIGGAVGRVAGGVLGTVRHVADLPTGSDLRRLSHQMTVLTSEVRALALTRDDPPPREVRSEEADHSP